MKAGLGVGVFLLALMVMGPAPAQNYTLDWSSIDGGGGTSTGGVFSVVGTIGQPDAGTAMKGGNYSIDGGFWGLIAAIQALGAPWLTITRTTTNSVIISWPSASTGWTLQQNGNLNSTNWVGLSTTPNDDGNTKSVTVAPPLGNRFYRLQKP